MQYGGIVFRMDQLTIYRGRDLTMNCWEFKNCPEDTHKACPAYPARGLDCWKVTGTKCEKGKMEKATVHEKIAYCRECGFYVKYASKF